MKPTHTFRLSLWVIVFLFLNTCQNISAQTWQTVFELERTTVNQNPINRVYTVPSGGPFRYRITVRGGNGGATAVPTGTSAGGRGGVFTSEFDLATGWTLDCVAGSNGVGTDVLRYGCGGGGSSGIYIYTPGFNGPLIVAGGGGGSGGGFVFSNYAGGDAGGYSNPGSGGGGGAGSTGIYPSPNDWGGGGGAGLSGNGGLNNYGYGGVLHTAGGGRGGASIIHPNFTSRVMLGGGGFTGGGGGSSLFASAGGGGGGYSGGGGGGNGFNESIPDGYGGGGGTSFISTLGYNISAFSHAAYTSAGGSVKVEILVRTSDFGTIIPTGIPNDLVFEFNQLEALYKATNGDNWTNKTNWLTGGDMAAWHGVTLTADGKSVLKIELPSNNLNNQTGSTVTNIPDLNIPELQTLHLGFNALKGTIPNFNYLPALQILKLNTNQFSGSIPNFANLGQLSELNLAINNLTGAVPNFPLNWVTHIDLGLNHLTGTLPAFGYSYLNFLSVYGNQLSGSVPTMFLPALQTLYLTNNNFSGDLPNIVGTMGFISPNNVYLENNRFNFSNLLGKLMIQGTGTVVYAPQQKIDITLTNGVLEVNTGIPNTPDTQDFKWYKDNVLVATTNTNWYRPTATGVYRCEIVHNTLTVSTNTNKNLNLISNNITVSTILKSNAGRDLPADLPVCLLDDFNELEKIYDATAGASWTNKTNWFTSGNIASWHGVWGMSVDGCNVADLVLNGNNLNGVLPNLNFPSATRLSFAGNLLRGVIPTITAPNLTILGFGTNQLSGEIPNFSFNLNEFYFENNQFIYGDMLDGTATKGWINTPILHYKDQAKIPISFNNCVLSVNTGVVDATQTFIWYKKETNGGLTEVGRTNNGQFTPSVSGTYLCHAYHFVLSRSDIPSRNLVLISEEYIYRGTNYRLYVKPTASGNGSGDSWANAMGGLQTAIDEIKTCANNTVEIWVAGGTYKATKDENGTIVAANSRTFVVPNGTNLYGSFAGTEANLSERTPSVIRANPTILSGDFSNNDGITGTGSSLVFSNYTENSLHIIGFNAPTVPTRLDGFTITGGAGGSGTYFGAALGQYGGGVFIYNAGTNVTIANCIITKNGGFFGAGLFNQNSSPTIENCVFERNRAESNGGGMANYAASTPTVRNCIFSGNRANIVGGGIANFAASNMTITNSTIVGNSGPSGGGFYNDNSNSTLTNTLIWANGADGLNNFQSTPTVTHSVLQATYTGTGNTTADPQFRNSANPVGADGIWGTSDDGLQLTCSSSAFNTGTNSPPLGVGGLDFLGASRPQFGTTDIGAYESLIDIASFTATISETGTDCTSKTVNVSTTPSWEVGGLFAWSGGSTPSVSSNIFTTSGTYTVTVTNTNGCTATANTTITITPLPTRLYVNAANTNATKNGLTWATAFSDLQSALSACKTSGAEIWVAKGTYKPTADKNGAASPSDNRTKTFFLTESIKIYGGFAGTETNLTERTPSVIRANPTILSGDFSGNDVVSGNGGALSISGFEENAYHIVLVTSSGTTRLDGFTISGGCANLTSNYADYGGGVLCLNGGNFTLANCILTKNAGNYGGGLSNVGSTTSTQILNSAFERNLAFLHGASVANYLSSASTFNNCVFTGGYALQVGGVIYNNSSTNVLNNCTLIGNASALSYGATLYNDVSTPTLTNCIIWANQPAAPFVSYLAADPVVNYSIIQGGFSGTNNTSTDPLFTNTADPDGTDNQWFTSDDGLHLACGSPAFNTGTSTSLTTDILGNNRTQFTTTDRGAYENTINVAAPTITISGATTGCLSVTLTANGGSAYAWSGGSTPSVASNTFTTSGTYTVIVTNALGCMVTTNTTITVNAFTKLYVNAANTAATTKDGLSWATAFDNLQAAFSACRAANAEIWVAGGTYKPSQDVAGTAVVANVYNTFLIPEGIKIYGGFAGTEANLSERTPSVMRANPTILSGDFLGNDAISGEGNNLNINNISENALHVVTFNAPSVATRLDGFTIKSGLAISNTPFLSITNGNSYGSGIFIKNGGSNITIENCQIIENYATTGAGLAVIGGAPIVKNCVFSRNYTFHHGAAVFNTTSAAPHMSNCVFWGNRASGGVGGVAYNLLNSQLTLINCTAYNNAAIAGGGSVYNDGSTTTITNSILWNTPNNTSQFGSFNGGTVTASFSIIENFTGGTNNSNANPQFKNAADPNGADNQWFTSDDGLQLACNSPAYNTGTNTGAPTTDITGTTRPQFSQTDMGAYESVDILNFTVSLFETVNCGSTSLTATLSVILPSGTTYTFTSGMASTSNSKIYTAAGTYSVTVTTPNGCTATTSQAITFNTTITPTVSIAASPSNNIASGTNVTFTATPTNGGTTPQYQWFVNNNPIGTNSATFSSTTLAHNDEIKCVLTPNNTCQTTATATSNTVKMSVCQAGTRLYVKQTASGTGDGSSWANAMGDLQAAINSPCNGEIWVAAGTYKPTHDENGAIKNDQTRVFALSTGTQLYGSFAGTETNLSERTPLVRAANPTILSGDFSDNDVVTGSGSNLSLVNYGENAYHILAFHNTSAATRLDGFTITGGSGGGGNVFNRGVGNHGGGIWVYGAGNFVTITNCIITKNGAVYGGGMMNINSSPSLNNCVFDRNSASINHGGGIYNHTNSRPTVTNCVFSGNYARIVGGGIGNFNNSSMTMINATMHGNYAQAGGGFYNDNSNATITNSIIWNNTTDGLNNYQSTPTVTYSTLQATFTGTGNSTTDPSFINAADPDGTDNQWLTADDGLHLSCNSPARDAGTEGGAPVTDVLGKNIFNTKKDIGAYEKQDNNGCSIFVGTAACQSVTINGVSGNQAYNFFINNQLIATLNPNGQNLGNVTAEIGDPTGITSLSGLKYLGRNINITSTIQPTINYTLCLYYKDSELTEYNTASNTTIAPSNLEMAWKSGGTGCDLLTYNSSNSGTVIKAAILPVDYGVNNDGFYLQFNLNHFTLFAPTGSSTPLPVELLNFYGNTEGDKNFLQWQTGVENGTSHFDIERSLDGINFIKIGETKTRGSNATYAFVDDKPKFSLNYYRLKINDLDGKTSFSKIISLDNKNIEGDKIKVYPNPVDTYLNIELAEPTEPTEEVVIINGTGQIILKKKVSGQSQCVLDLHLLPSGVYVLKTKADKKGIKFIKL